MDEERRLAYHTQFLRQVAQSGPVVEVMWKIEEVLPSLRFIAENGSIKDKDAAKAVGSIFSQTQDSPTKDLCLSALRRIGNEVAQKEMRRILDDETVALRWRITCAQYLGISLPQGWKTAETGMSIEFPTNVLPSP
jgi:hypothetical protein